MKILKGFKYRLKLKNKQETSCFRFAGSGRFVFNRGLQRRIDAYETDKEVLRYFDQNLELRQWKLDPELSWLQEIHSQVLQQSLKDLDSAFQHFYRKVKNKEEKAGFPKFKKKGINDSFRYPQGVKIEDNRVYLPKIGWVRFRKSREIEGKLKQTTIVREGRYWYVCFTCELEIPDPKIAPIDETNALGIDLGISSFATLAIGEKNDIRHISHPRYLKQLLARIKKYSKILSRREYKSKNWHKCRRYLANLHTKTRDCRNDFLHKLSTHLIETQDVLCVESLSVKKLLQDGSKSLSQAIGDSGWRQFLLFLRYKASVFGKHFVEIDRYFPSSQICSRCDHRQKMPLSTRLFFCEKCSFKIDRDENAGINIKTAGMTVLRKSFP